MIHNVDLDTEILFNIKFGDINGSELVRSF